MAAKATYQGPPEALRRYEALVAAHPEVDRKGAKNPYTSRNGHMFSFLDAEGRIALRLSEELREQYAAGYPAEPVMQYGRVMNGYVYLPEQLLADAEHASAWFTRSHEWVSTLKPKATRR